MTRGKVVLVTDKITYKQSIPSSIRDLINDADAIQKMLTELSEQINHFTGGHEL